MDGIRTCEECGHKFDPSDSRGYVRDDTDVGRRASVCPACRITANGGMPAWALWNSCQGIWPDLVFHSRAEARQKLDELNDPDCYEAVVPVRVFKERDDRVWLREWIEDEDEIHRSQAAEDRPLPQSPAPVGSRSNTGLPSVGQGSVARTMTAGCHGPVGTGQPKGHQK